MHFHTEPNTKENRWLSNPFFHNPRIQFGNRRNKTHYTPELFGLEFNAETLTLGQIFVNQKPITKDDLDNLGFVTSDSKYKLLKYHLEKVSGLGKYLMLLQSESDSNTTDLNQFHPIL